VIWKINWKLQGTIRSAQFEQFHLSCIFGPAHRPLLLAPTRLSTVPAHRDAESDRAASSSCPRSYHLDACQSHHSFDRHLRFDHGRFPCRRQAMTSQPRAHAALPCQPQRVPATDSECSPMPPSRCCPPASQTTTHPGHLRLEGEHSSTRHRLTVVHR
jgi:hypothetical protein